MNNKSNWHCPLSEATACYCMQYLALLQEKHDIYNITQVDLGTHLKKYDVIVILLIAMQKDNTVVSINVAVKRGTMAA